MGSRSPSSGDRRFRTHAAIGQPLGKPKWVLLFDLIRYQSGRGAGGEARTDTQQTAQPVDKSDHVFNKAISAIAAKMQNSASVELVEMKRAEKNASGKSIDTICGYVRGKSASGLDTGDRPFLYLVQEDQAYIGLYDIATSRYPQSL
jgi:hypothetical protein